MVVLNVKRGTLSLKVILENDKSYRYKGVNVILLREDVRNENKTFNFAAIVCGLNI